MKKIHPTAIIHSSAELADDVEVGAYVCIEGHAVIGQGCKIQSHAILAGNVKIGKNNVIGYGAVVGAEPQDHAFHPKIKSEVIIGNDNLIREYCTIHRGTAEGSATVVGNHNFLMAGTHLGHNVKVGNKVIIANNVLLAGHVEVQDGAFIGGGCALHQYVRVGQVSISQGVSALAKDVPPFTIVADRSYVVGLNVVGLRRAGYTAEQRREIKEAFKLLYKSGLNTTQALERAKEQKWNKAGRAFFDFVAAATKRGICDIRESA
ncbi:MAG: acyl-ACP--UDP-N-acetylglucosamine O-acyltransferase [Chthoniobacteraceae bacterium]